MTMVNAIKLKIMTDGFNSREVSLTTTGDNPQFAGRVITQRGKTALEEKVSGWVKLGWVTVGDRCSIRNGHDMVGTIKFLTDKAHVSVHQVNVKS